MIEYPKTQITAVGQRVYEFSRKVKCVRNNKFRFQNEWAVAMDVRFENRVLLGCPVSRKPTLEYFEYRSEARTERDLVRHELWAGRVIFCWINDQRFELDPKQFGEFKPPKIISDLLVRKESSNEK